MLDLSSYECPSGNRLKHLRMSGRLPPSELTQGRSGIQVQVWPSTFLRWKKWSIMFARLKNNCLNGKGEFVPILLLTVSALLGCAALFRIAGFFAASVKAEELVKRAAAGSRSDAGNVQRSLEVSREMADALKKNNLFAPPAPRQHPVKQVQGILGDEVLINGEWHKVGDYVDDARIVTIEPTLAKIEWEGSERVFEPINDSGSESPERQRSRTSRTDSRARARGTDAGNAVVVVVGDDQTSRGGRTSSEKLSEKEKAKQQKVQQKLRLLAEKKKSEKLLNDKPKKKQANAKEPVGQAKKKANKKPANKTAKVRK